MRGEHPVLAVDRHQCFGSDECEQGAKLLGAGVTRHVHRGDLLVQHLGAETREAVDRVVHVELVPGHRFGGDDHRVTTLDLDVLVVAVGDPRECRHRLALAAGTEEHDAARRQLHRLLGRHHRVLRQVDVAERARDVHVLSERTADERNLSVVLDRHLGGLLHPVDVRREARDQDTTCTHRDQLPERLTDEPFRAGHPGPLRVGRVAEHEVDALVTDRGELADVRLEAVDGGVVELPVAGVQHPPGGCFDHDCNAVGDRVRHPDELEPEGAELDAVAVGVCLAQCRRCSELVLIEL